MLLEHVATTSCALNAHIYSHSELHNTEYYDSMIYFQGDKHVICLL